MTVWVAGWAAALAPRAAAAQVSTRGQPKSPFSVADFAKFRWLAGSWAGTAPDSRDIFARYRVVDDSTMDIAYYTDSTFASETGTGRLYLSVGRIFHTMGPQRWGATHVDEKGAYFVPQTNAHNTYAWAFQSKNEWTATLRTGFVGQDRVTIYHMRRTRP